MMEDMDKKMKKEALKGIMSSMRGRMGNEFDDDGSIKIIISSKEKVPMGGEGYEDMDEKMDYDEKEMKNKKRKKGYGYTGYTGYEDKK